MRDSDGHTATETPGQASRWAAPVGFGEHTESPVRPGLGPVLGPELRLGRQVSHIDWPSTLHHRLDHVYYADAQGLRPGPYEFSSGTNQLPPPRVFTDALRRFGPNDYWEINTYTGPLGDTALRDAVVTYENAVNGWRLVRDNVAITYGAHEGLRIALKALHARGNRRALILGPQVPLVFQALLREGFALQELWAADPRALLPSAGEALRGIARCAPDIVVLTSPNNPTGTAYRAAELEAIGAAAIDRGCVLVVDKILSDSSLPGSPMANGTCGPMGQWVAEGRCLVVDSLSKRRALSGIRAGYLLAAEEVVTCQSMVALGGCPPLLLATAAAADLNRSARLHTTTEEVLESDAPEAHVPKGEVLEGDRRHAEDLLRMRAAVEHNFQVARRVLEDFWVWDSKRPGRFNCVVGLRTRPGAGDDRDACLLLFTRQVTCYPLSTFAADPRLMEGREADGLLEARLTCAMDPARFEETMRRTRSALRTLGL